MGISPTPVALAAFAALVLALRDVRFVSIVNY